MRVGAQVPLLVELHDSLLHLPSILVHELLPLRALQQLHIFNALSLDGRVLFVDDFSALFIEYEVALGAQSGVDCGDQTLQLFFISLVLQLRVAASSEERGPIGKFSNRCP